MAQYRYVYSTFWNDPLILECFTPEDKLFFLYLLTNSHTTQMGVYRITKKEIAFELGYSIESINSLMDRFLNHHKLIKYNEITRELAIKNWGKYNLNKGGKPVEDCIKSELKNVDDKELIHYVCNSVKNDKIKQIFIDFINSTNESENSDLEEDSNTNIPDDTYHDTSPIRGQNENKNENKKIYIMQSGEESPDKVKADKVPYEEIIDMFNTSCKSLPKVKARSKGRDKSIKSLFRRCGNLDNIKNFFNKVESSNFLSGRDGKWLNCNFDWIMKEGNYIKIIEGSYDNIRQNRAKGYGGGIKNDSKIVANAAAYKEFN